MTNEPMPRIALSIPKEMLERVEEWRRKQPAIPSRSQAIRHLIAQGLMSEGSKIKK